MQSRISRMGSLSTECARYYAAQLVDALDYMHSKGVIHRCVLHTCLVLPRLTPLPSDLKPENLLFRTKDEDADIMIADFGLSRVMDDEKFHLLTEICGTPGVRSPVITAS